MFPDGTWRVAFRLVSSVEQEGVHFTGSGGSLFGAILSALNSYTEYPLVLLSSHVELHQKGSIHMIMLRFGGTDKSEGFPVLSVGEGGCVIESFVRAYRHAQLCSW